jgi:hypothetical protein
MSRGSLLTIDNTCTGGTLTVTGAGIVTDNSNGTTVTIKVDEADLVEIGSDAQSMTDLKDFADAGYDPATNKVEGVKTVDTTTTNTDMVGTNNALLAANVNVAAGVVESNLKQIDGVAQSMTDLKDFADAGYDPSTNKVEGVKTVDTTTTNTDMRGTDGANTTVPDAAGTAAGLHGTTDGKIDAVQADLGDFSGRTNNQSLLAVLGVPDVAGKDLHTLVVTDRLDHAAYGLSAIEALVDDLESRLTAARAGYLDELAAANIPADIDTLLARLTAARAGYLDALNGHTPQTGDSFGRLGAPAGASVSADIAAVKADTANIETDTQDIQSRIPAALVGGRMDSDIGNIQNNAITAASIATDAIGADEIAAGGATEIANSVDVVLAAAHGAGSWEGGGAAPTVAQIRAEMDANSTQLAAIVTDTNEIQTDLADGGRLDLLIDAILADTNELQGDWANGGRLDLLLDQVIADIAALNNLSAAQVNAEMLDVLNTDTFAEPAQGAPPATTSLQLKLAYLYKAFRNKLETTGTEARIFNDAGAVVDHKASISDDGATFTRGEFGTGP